MFSSKQGYRVVYLYEESKLKYQATNVGVARTSKIVTFASQNIMITFYNNT